MIKLTHLSQALFLGVILIYSGSLFSAENPIPYDDSTIVQLKKELQQHSERDSAKVKLLYNISNQYLYPEVFDLVNAKVYAEKALILSEEIKFNIGIATSYKLLGIISGYQGDFDNARLLFSKSFVIYEQEGQPIHAAGVLYNIGMNYEDLYNYEKSSEYYSQALEIYINENYPYGIAKTHNALGFSILSGSKDTTLAKIHFSEGIKCAKENNLDEVVQAIYFNYIGVLNEIEDSDEIIEIYKSAVIYAKEIKSDFHLWTVYFNLLYQYLIIEDYDNAIIYGEKSLDVAEELKKQTYILDSHNGLQEMYQAIGDYQSAYYHLKIADSIDAVILNEETERNISELEVKFETEQKEQENKILKRNNIIEKQKADLNKRMFWGTVIMGSLLLLVFWLWFLKYRQKKNSEKRENSIQMEQLNKQIDLLQANVNARTEAPKIVEPPKILLKDINHLLSSPLSDRELEVLNELSKGFTNQQIADNLFISINTVKTHLLKIYAKLDVNNRVQAVKKISPSK